MSLTALIIIVKIEQPLQYCTFLFSTFDPRNHFHVQKKTLQVMIKNSTANYNKCFQERLLKEYNMLSLEMILRVPLTISWMMTVSGKWKNGTLIFLTLTHWWLLQNGPFIILLCPECQIILLVKGKPLWCQWLVKYLAFQHLVQLEAKWCTVLYNYVNFEN